MQWVAIFQKELLEHWRNRKWIWVPLVIMLLASMDPVTFYYLPEILEFAGGLPEEAVFEIPPLEPGEVIMMSLEQLNIFGVLLIALISMGTIAAEKKSGIADILFVKPINPLYYVTAKWTGFLFILWTSLFLGLFMSWYYINLLFGTLSFTTLLLVVFFYGIWLTFVLSVSIFYNTFFKTPGIVLACTIGTLLVMGALHTVFAHKWPFYPNNLSSYIFDMVQTNTVSKNLIGTSSIILLLISILLISSIQIFKKKKL